MNAGTDVANYLTNALPADLQLALGYFAVRNRAPAEAKQGGLTVRDGFAAEQAYFRSHPSYGGAPAAVRERLGVPQLSAFLSRVLLLQVKRHKPALMANPNPNPRTHPHPHPRPHPHPHQVKRHMPALMAEVTALAAA